MDFSPEHSKHLGEANLIKNNHLKHITRSDVLFYTSKYLKIETFKQPQSYLK